jgi:hypothetical protein
MAHNQTNNSEFKVGDTVDLFGIKYLVEDEVDGICTNCDCYKSKTPCTGIDCSGVIFKLVT